jgi:GDP-L-fucose synthase
MDQDMRIVLTGGNGFLGQAVVEELSSRGYENVVTFSSKQYDITRQEDTRKMFLTLRPDIIIHLAARVGGIGANMKNPGKFAYDNLIMGLNVLEEARLQSTSKVVVAGTICAYPCNTPVPFQEKNLYDGYPEPTNAPYGMAKKMLLVMSQAYRAQYGCNYIFLLPVNLYGERDTFNLENSHVIPAMLRKFHEAKTQGLSEVVLWGDGSPTREFLYVRDCASAFVNAMETYDGASPINIGTGKEISMIDLATLIKNIVQYNGKLRWDISKPNGQPRRCLDISRAHEMLNWRATTILENGLKKTYEWYLDNKAKGETSERI